MKRPLHSLFLLLCLLLTVLLLAACGFFRLSGKESGKEENAQQETLSGKKDAAAAEDSTVENKKTEATAEAEPEPAPEWRALEQDELDVLSDALDWSINGSFVTTYSRPEEIDWNEVFYNGAGMARKPSESELAEYENFCGPAMTSLVCIDRENIESFVREKTGIEYSAARHPLQWYVTDSGLYMTQHGDTNARQIRFTEGTAAGNEYRLVFPGTDYVNYRFERDFVVSVRIEEGRWLFRSNLPLDAPSPIDLLDIRYVETDAEAVELGAEYFYKVQQLPSDEPYGWCWAVLTAKEDGVRFAVDRLRAETDMEQILSDSFGLILPGENVASGILKKGESVAVWVNRPWHPRVRVSASKGAFSGDYIFGEDNWLHLDDSVVRYVIGHDCDGEGRGTNWSGEVDLVNFLSNGAWEYKNELTGETLAGIRFEEYRSMVVDNGSEYYRIFLEYDRIYTSADDAPDLLKMKKYFTDDSCWDEHSFIFSQDGLGDYLISAIQLDGEQILTLQQANNGDGILNYILPQADSSQHEFTFHRYIGTAASEGQG